jgi:hypothetical protein
MTISWFLWKGDIFHVPLSTVSASGTRRLGIKFCCKKPCLAPKSKATKHEELRNHNMGMVEDMRKEPTHPFEMSSQRC